MLTNTLPFLFFYATTPPRDGASDETISKAATRLANRTARLPLDGLIVYDVQDESSRTLEPRPFPFLPTIDPRRYSQLLNSMTGRTVINYKCIAGMTEMRWQQWLAETRGTFQIENLVLVGMPSSNAAQDALPLSQAIQSASQQAPPFTVGGVTIAERHGDDNRESNKILRKAHFGCQFFVSQAVYDPATTIHLLRDYARDCERLAIEPKRIILTFTPCGRDKTMAFMKWLGVSMPSDVQAAILSSETPLAESIKICADNLHRILDESMGYGLPLGLNVESVSIQKDEIDASLDLFDTLRSVAREYSP